MPVMNAFRFATAPYRSYAGDYACDMRDTRDGRRRLPRLASRRAAAHARGRPVRRRPPRLRPDARGRRRTSLRRCPARARLSPRRRGRRHRCESRQSRPLLVREPHDGRARPRAGAAARSPQGRDPRHDMRLPEVHSGPVPRETTCGTVTPRRRTRRTALRRRRSSSARRLTASSTGWTQSSCCRSTCTGRATTSIRPTSHVIPDLIRKMVESPDEIVLWGDGSPTREFLYVDDAAEGLLLAAERYDGAEPVNLGTGVRDLDSGARRADRRADGLRG